MSSLGDNAYWNWSESSEKFDYYITGLASAVVVFAMRDIGTEEVGVTPYGLHLLSIAFLLACIFFGLKRVEATNVLKLNQHVRLHAQERIGAHNDPKLKGIVYNKATGEVYEPGDSDAVIDKALKEIASTVEPVKKCTGRSKTFYKWRNRTLIVGVLGLVLAKVWAGYQASQSITVTLGDSWI